MPQVDVDLESFLEQTSIPPEVVRALAQAEIELFSAPAGAGGGRRADREILIIYRGQGCRFDVHFNQGEKEVMWIRTEQLQSMIPEMIDYLKQKAIQVDQRPVGKMEAA